MEILLLLIAGVVVYFLYNTLQDYLKNPINQQSYPKQLEDTNINFQNAYEQVSVVEKAKSNEFSVLAAILGNFIVWSKMKTCPLEKELLDGILTDMASESKNPKLSKEELSKIVKAKTKHFLLDLSISLLLCSDSLICSYQLLWFCAPSLSDCGFSHVYGL